MSDTSSEGYVKSKEKKRKLDLDDFEEEDEEETKHSKRRKHLGNLILDEAAVNEDDDDEEYEGFDDGDIIDHPDDEAEVQDAIEHLQCDNRRNLNNLNFQNDEEIEEYYRNRYEENDTDDFGTGNAMASAISQQKSLPGVKDPNLWQITCMRGEEKNSVLTLMNKFIFAQYTNSPLLIKSAFSKDNVQGFIYIEAFKETHVKKAIEDIRNLSRSINKLKMVSINEMTDVMKVLKSFKKLQPGQWVRLAKGVYKDDLAKIIGVEDAQNSVYLQLIPRIDVKKIKDSNNRSRWVRPSQILLTKKRIAELGLDCTKNGDKVVFKSNEFDDKGFLYKSFRISHIISERVKPEMHELENFNENPNSSTVTSAIKKNFEEMDSLLTVGDTVEVCKGFLRELRGKVISIEGKNVSVLPLENDLKDPMLFQPDELRKIFFPGNHVKIIQGKYEGETGMVVAYDFQIAVVMSDMNMTQFKIHPRYLQLCNQGTACVNSSGNFQIGDLIQIDPQTVGVVIKFEKNKMNVLSTSNKVISLNSSSSLRKKNSNRSCGLDAENNEIRPKDIVNIIDGNYFGQQGEVKHVYKSFSFIYNRNSTENAGFISIKNRLLSKKWKGNKIISELYQGPTNCVPQSPCLHQEEPRNPRNNEIFKFKTPNNSLKMEKKFVGSTARIIKGPLKGNIGIIKEIKVDTATIELHSMFKTVKVVKENFALLNNAGRIIDSHFGATSMRAGAVTGGNSNWGGKTPIYGYHTPMYGSSTPHYHTIGDDALRHLDNSGGRTPHIGSQTPRQYGSENETPRATAFDPAGATPAHHTSYDIFDENVDIKISTEQSPLSALSNSSPAFSSIYNQLGHSDLDRGSPIIGEQSLSNKNISGTPMCSGYNIFTPATPGNDSVFESNSYYENSNFKNNNNQLAENKLVHLQIEHVYKNVIVLARLKHDEIKKAVIQASNGDIVSLRLPDEKRVVSIRINDIYRLNPEAGNTVIYFNNENNVEIGQCLSIDNGEGVVKIKSPDEPLKLCPLHCLEPFND